MTRLCQRPAAANSRTLALRRSSDAAIIVLLLGAAAAGQAIPALAAEGASHAASSTLFIAELALLLFVGRLMGEAAQRIGQPSVMGQLIAGLLLGPSFFGLLWPSAQHAIFPLGDAAQKSMLDAVSELGVLMLLLLTGMETDLQMVRRVGRAAIAVSAAGVAIPFACGFALGELLPAAFLPKPEARFVTAIFLGTALSISSVKIVAMVIREMNFMRRDLGQIIVASAILEDTIGWGIIAVAFGLAAAGSIDVWSVGRAILGTGLFMLASFTVGRPRDSIDQRQFPERLSGHHHDPDHHGGDGADHAADWRQQCTRRICRRHSHRRVADPDAPYRPTIARPHRRFVHAGVFGLSD